MFLFNLQNFLTKKHKGMDAVGVSLNRGYKHIFFASPALPFVMVTPSL